MRRHSHAHRARIHWRMPRRQRLTIYWMSAALWITGVLWWVLNQFFYKEYEFGRQPHPWEDPVLLIHGVLAILSAYALGWVAARHIWQWWTAAQRRWSGGLLTAMTGLLSLTGFGLLFASTDWWQRIFQLSHEAIGFGIVLFALQHWLFGRRVDYAEPSP